MPGPSAARERARELLGIVLRVCDAAALAHAAPDPRNLSPDITVGSRGQVHVTDATVVIGRVHPMRRTCRAPRQDDAVRPHTWRRSRPGRRRDFDARTDVYGIGGILYASDARTPMTGSASADLALAKAERASRGACRPSAAALCRIACVRYPPPSDASLGRVLRHDIEHFRHEVLSPPWLSMPITSSRRTTWIHTVSLSACTISAPTVIDESIQLIA